MSISQNYFQLFGLAEQFDIDVSQLASSYREIQRKTHPDRHAHEPRRDQLLSVQYAATVNDAYETLSSPLRRAIYLLKMKGMDLTEDTSTQMDPVFLMQQIELRETLEAAQHSANPEIGLEKVAAELDNQLRENQEKFKQALSCSSEKSLDNAADQVRRMQFVVKMQQEVERLEEELLDY